MPGVYDAHKTLFDRFEIFSVIFFTIEYLFRVWSSVESHNPRFKSSIKGRLRYMLTPLALIDLIVILPFSVSALVGVDLRMLRALRLLRVFRLTRYAKSMNLLLQVLRDEGPIISAALFVLLMLISVAASITYLAEHEAQPEAFASIPHALWWAVVTMTTIGYGDVAPVTLIGRISEAAIGIVSVGMVALPAGILTSGFNEALHKRRKQYEDVVDTHSRMASLIQTIMNNFVSYKKSWGYLLMKPQTCSKLVTVKYLQARRFADSVAKQFYVRKTPMTVVALVIEFPSSARQRRTILFLAYKWLPNYAVWQFQDHLL